MSKLKMTLGLLGAFLVGCVASQMTALVVPPARAGTAPQRWEYACKNEYDPDAVTIMANAFGKEGWEMSGATGHVREKTWCFKRALP